MKININKYIDEYDLISIKKKGGTIADIWSDLAINRLETNQLSHLLYLVSFHSEVDDIIFQLLADGADPDFKNELWKENELDCIWPRIRMDTIYPGSTPIGQTIFGSVNKNNTFVNLEILLNSGANLNKITYSGYTPLQLAIVNSSPEFATLLLSKGADPYQPSSDFDEPDAFEFAKDYKWAKVMLSEWIKKKKKKSQKKTKRGQI